MKHRIYTLILIAAGLLSLLTDSFAQQRPVTIYGNVKSYTGIPLMGVAVTVQDHFINTETDENGDFSIEIPSLGSVLVFNTEYYKERFITVNSTERLMVLMEEAPEGQGKADRVFLPFRETQKRNLTASVATMGSEELSKSKVTSLGNALAGRLLGLSTRQTGANPGSDAASLLVRGVRTLYSDNDANALKVYSYCFPLIIVDGFEREFSELDAEEIESFSILKDAVATSLYGIRGANGVIMVTTKRGESNKRKIEFKYNEGVLTPTDCLPDNVDAYTYASWYNEALRNDGYAPVYTERDLALYKSGESPMTHPDNDYYPTFMKKFASQRKASITMSGGNQIAKYFILAGYTSQDGLWKYSNYNDEFPTMTNYSKYNIRSNVDVNITKWLTASMDVAGRIEERKYPYASASAILSALNTPANAYPISFTGIDPNLLTETFMLGGNSVYTNNPLGLLAFRGYNEQTRRYYQVSAHIKADLGRFVTPGLSAEFNGHLDGYNYYLVSSYKSFSVWKYSKSAFGDDIYDQFVTASTLSRSGSYDTERYYGFDANLRYQKSVGLSNFDAMIYWNQRLKEVRQNNQSDYRNQDCGFIFSYSLANKYFLDITGDYGGSEKLYLSKYQREFYPAVGLGWVISGENFMKGARWIDYLKMKASYGLSGQGNWYFTDVNGDEERFASAGRWWMSSTWQYFGTAATSTTTIARGRMDNPLCRAEKSAMTNVALEGSLFRHRLDFDLEYWFDHRYDIYTAGVGLYPHVLGEEERKLPITNDGVVNSQGIEVMLNWKDRIGDFSYSVGGNFAIQKSKILEMGEPYRAFKNLVQTGNQVRQEYGLKSLGLFKDMADVENSPAQLFGTYGPGDIKYEDVNGDNFIDANDYVPIGNGRDPKLNFGIILSAQYKGFGLELLFQGASMCSLYADSNSMRAFYGNGTAQNFMAGRFHYDENGNSNWAEATYPRFTSQLSDNNWRASDYWMYDASYYRLKNVELSYTLPQKALRSTMLNKARIYLNAYNPMTWTALSKYHIDPEDCLAGTEHYPLTRNFSIGIDLTF